MDARTLTIAVNALDAARQAWTEVAKEKGDPPHEWYTAALLRLMPETNDAAVGAERDRRTAEILSRCYCADCQSDNIRVVA